MNLKILNRIKQYPSIVHDYGLIKLFNCQLNDVDIFKRKPKMHSYPQFIDLALTDKCNLKCIMCPRTTDKSIKLGEMDYDTAVSIIDQVSRYSIKIQLAGGLGEPLLYPKIFELIEYCKSKRMYTMLTTNGTLLNNKNINKIINSNLDYISISLDGATKSTYEKIRVNADYYSVIDGIEALCKLRTKLNHDLRIELVPVIIPNINSHEIVKLKTLSEFVGADDIIFSDLNYINRNINSNSSITCFQPWYMIAINTNGDVRPCCGVHDYFVGNVHEQSLKEIWHGNKFKSWRRKMTSINPPEQCMNCTMRN